MRFTPKNRAQRAAAAGVIALAVLGVSSCSAVNEQATVREYSPSDGIVENVGEVELRNILVVSNGDGEAGRLLGTVVNASPEAVDFSLALGGTTLTWNIGAGDKVVFEDTPSSEVTVPNVDTLPGTGLRADASNGTETVDLDVPVVDGTLESYREYLPTPAGTPSDMATMLPSDQADTEQDTGADTGVATEPAASH
ncbi:hypothetical protein QNO08_01855 [Arthrobacter sp. zg-Y820]|uniref:hypothetical protein n=1 Tax=unclassified Arthrobacter TaxID=235627 RepID=UPI001E3E2570|nr:MULTISPECIES: hypothetical protein [unclassified Arthrobacter]MCC9198391.1 hypothetical protein [Arthrobacter sp. zg-Y820]MDK1281261.1 hypothetical protein [Arthrobacter sp. zg.Y820]MDK1361431.1 hypothetical protein [Arthrobacter sp. zg-Y1219]WIB09846.1 hypothetical protein QNO08_01855 [Arthrobacter sp. zg-Y820]